MDWLRYLLMIFYAPVRGMRGMRDRGSLAPVVLIAFLSQFAYSFVMERYAGTAGRTGIFSDLFLAAMTVVLVAVVDAPRRKGRSRAEAVHYLAPDRLHARRNRSALADE